MSDVPIRRLMVSDFRRIEGTRELPFDAPIVLIHGPNGTGKTSVLSALELALTGKIRSMERQSDRYRAHLPFFGQSYATVRAEVAGYLQTQPRNAPLTVSGARLEGTPALEPDAAKFFAERCYLDQTSLSRLLDLYQARVGNEQTAIEEFVNELLGLEKLDALRGGLSDANDLRLLKKLAAGVDEADREAKATVTQLKEQSELRKELRAEVASARAATRDAISRLQPGIGDNLTDADLQVFLKEQVNDDIARAESAVAENLHQEVIALGGRISGLVDRATTQRIQELRAELALATADEAAWEAADGVKVRDWRAAAHAAGANPRSEPRIAVEQAVSLARQELDNAADVRVQVESVNAQVTADRADLDLLQVRLTEANEHSSALVESLSALRTVVNDSNWCPVCDRDFSETGHGSLPSHIDAKLIELTGHGRQLVDLRNDRDKLAARLAVVDVERAQLTARLLPAEQEQAIADRHAELIRLQDEVESIQTAISTGANIAQRVRDLQQSVDGLVSASSEAHYVESELARYAKLLEIDLPLGPQSFQEAATQLIQGAEARVSLLASNIDLRLRASIEARRLADAVERESVVARRVADIAELNEQWDARVFEAKRRQGVAKEVHDAATQARSNIVHRVFTESLNEVWKTVFTRLAPNEGFIPRFGIPSTTKKTFDINLETVHRNGEASGPPQMMLSAGNLNTAALSLFIALHLAVQPVVPCLVFDDPVQAMDEVHIAQFAGLIRLLSKQNGRQVVIAVHERELFDYLALELSPAYEGDELITIELGDRATDQDEGVIRHPWTPDLAIAN